MFKLKPIHGIAVVAAVVLGGVVLSSGGATDPHQRVTAGKTARCGSASRT